MDKIILWTVFGRATIHQIEQFDLDLTAYEHLLARSQDDFWLSLDGRGFEVELAGLFQATGFDVNLTPMSGDSGIDIELKKGNYVAIVQCKAHKEPVGPSAIRELFGTLIACGADRAILASVSGFTQGTEQFAIGKQIELMGLANIIALQNELTSDQQYGQYFSNAESFLVSRRS